MGRYIVELEKGVWLAPLEGDPGRTVVFENAKLFKTHIAALASLDDARRYRPFKNAKIIDTHESLHLLPCPFCGGEASIGKVKYHPSTVKEQEWGQSKFFYGSCMNCGANSKGMVGQKTKVLAAEKWNRRV